jgi:predicted nucleic-acid-binding protein
MEIKMVRIDANIVLRFFLKDNEEMFKTAYEILNGDVYLSNEVIAEIIYVLGKFYGFNRDVVFDRMFKLINERNILNFDKQYVLKALKIYKETKLDFVDCLLCAYGRY